MSVKGTEVPNLYSINVFKDPQVLARAACPFYLEGLNSAQKRVRGSSVPPFLGGLISAIRQEVAPQIPLRRRLAMGWVATGEGIAGGSSLLPGVDMETAYRVYGYRFPTNWVAGYSLIYGSAIGYVKLREKSLAKTREVTKEHYACITRIALSSASQIAASDKNDIMAASRKMLIWNLTTSDLTEAALSLAGQTAFMENFAKGPDDTIDGLLHRTIRWFNRYPSVKNLEEIRGLVDHRFDNQAEVARSYMEARRLQSSSS